MSDLDVNIKYAHGDIVYFKLGGDYGVKGIVTALIIRSKGYIEYEVVWDDKSSGCHSEIELTEDKPIEL